MTGGTELYISQLSSFSGGITPRCFTSASGFPCVIKLQLLTVPSSLTTHLPWLSFLSHGQDSPYLPKWSLVLKFLSQDLLWRNPFESRCILKAFPTGSAPGEAGQAGCPFSALPQPLSSPQSLHSSYNAVIAQAPMENTDNLLGKKFKWVLCIWKDGQLHS